MHLTDLWTSPFVRFVAKYPISRIPILLSKCFTSTITSCPTTDITTEVSKSLNDFFSIEADITIVGGYFTIFAKSHLSKSFSCI